MTIIHDPFQPFDEDPFNPKGGSTFDTEAKSGTVASQALTLLSKHLGVNRLENKEKLENVAVTYQKFTKSLQTYLDVVGNKGDVQNAKHQVQSAYDDLSFDISAGIELEKEQKKNLVDMASLDKTYVTSTSHNPEFKKKVLLAAEDSNNLQELHDFLSNGGVVSDYDLNEALSWASAQGHLNIVNTLIDIKGHELTPKVYSAAWKTAVKNGRKELVDAFLGMQDVEFRLGPLGEQLRWAVLYRPDPYAIKSLFSTGMIDQDIVERVLLEAVSEGDHKVVEALLTYKSKNGLTINPEIKNKALLESAKEGHSAIVKVLLSSGGISSDTIGSALNVAIKKGHEKVVEVLFTMKELISKDLKDALHSAIIQGHLSIGKFIFSKIDLSPEDEREARLLLGAMEGDLNSVKSSLPKEGSESKILSDALCLAAKAGRYNVVEFFVHLGPITLETQQRALHAAKDQPEIEGILNYAFVEGEDSPHNYAKPLSLSMEQLKADPKWYLQAICRKGFPSEINFLGEKGVDRGGLTREFITVLMESLVQNEGIGGLPNNSKLMREMGRYYVQLHAANLLHAKELEANGGEYVPNTTGTVFVPEFFAILKNIAEGQTGEQLITSTAEILVQMGNNPALLFILDPGNETKKREYIEALGLEDEQTTEQLLEDAKRDYVQPYVDAAKSFYEGVVGSELEGVIKQADPALVCRGLQGEEATAIGLIGALNIKEGDQHFAQKVAWLKEKIEGSDIEWRKRFLQLCTGSSTFSPGMKIEVTEIRRVQFKEGAEREAQFSIHTCINQIDIPDGEMTKEDFLKGIDNLLAADNEFNNE